MSAKDWYFKDWEVIDQLNAKGKIKHNYVYKGMFYLLPEPVKKFKTYCLATMGIYTVLFFLLAFFPADSAYNNQVGAICLLQIIPILFFLMCFYPLMKSPPKMTFRRYHRIFYRMRWGAGVAFFVLAAQMIMEIRFLILNGITVPDIVYVVILLADLAMMTVFAHYILMLKIYSDDPDPSYQLPPDE